MSTEEIEAAIQRLVERGIEPSVRTIREELGESGSFSTIGPILKAWRKAQSSKSATASPVPDVLTETAVALVEKCWALANKKTADVAQDARRGADLRIDALVKDVGELENSLEETETLADKRKLENDSLTQKLTMCQGLAGDLRSKLAVSTREIAMLRERLQELSGRPAKSGRASKPQKRTAQTSADAAATPNET
jgi:Plasmid replication region DNA-binding N-term